MIIINKILNVDDYFFDVFMSISEALTGFSLNELQATGLAETYYTHILSHLQAATFVDFLTISKNVFENSFTEEQLRTAIASEIMADSGLNDIAGKIITLWYLGTWEGAYVNDLSYKEGLVWNVMHAHPPGAKQPGYKSWGIKPVNSNS
ncbi:sugar dehydrogenase complex small subunit [Chryseobacterium arthrosphaerae]|uniref:sugar dehydrogenase complex small subunit n=1 Tax=Chryseobacterium arthrosphaerae TaxID=651561 RepID=UPI0023E218C9|nr:sugar dehydrogenase complex small subunit [Chryseobacterium arthrosphaerae]WES99273.1 sugar dehydrogenase complex small subunit [Chryseobacterium arthrosphaerae]